MNTALKPSVTNNLRSTRVIGTKTKLVSGTREGWNDASCHKSQKPQMLSANHTQCRGAALLVQSAAGPLVGALHAAPIRLQTGRVGVLGEGGAT